MATASAPETMDQTPYTPAGDLDDVLTNLEAIDVDGVDETDGPGTGCAEETDSTGTGCAEETDSTGTDENAMTGEAVLPVLDDAFDELADVVDEPEPIDEAEEPAAAEADDPSPHDESVLARQRAEFEAVAESTDVDFVPYDDAATYLASSLYAVPPANTRFQWVDDDGLAAE